MKKKLPIGVQKFPKLINEGFLYVDKTEIIHKLIDTGVYYFLSRPRRFGKSLLISTLNEIFRGNQELFKGLWIYDKIEWESNPVILLDFSEILSRNVPLETSISMELDLIAESYGLVLKDNSISQKFRNLIKTLGNDQKVAILVDEYDKPIINHIEDHEQAAENRDILKSLYSVIKGNDQHIKFALLTGVSTPIAIGVSHVSLFSDLNNLEDITIDRNFSELLGYTGKEVEHYFGEYMPGLEKKYSEIYPDVMQAIRDWYNGYSWDGEHFVYNPFSILNLMKKGVFQDYWFQTGTPTFLIKTLRKNGYSIFDLKNRTLNLNFFNKFEIENIEVNSLLFQTGYLTIKKFDLATNDITLDYPNREVEQSFNIHLLSEFSGLSKENASSLLVNMRQSLEKGDLESMVIFMNSMFKNIAYAHSPNVRETEEDREKYYHSIFYLCLLLLGYDIETEVMTLDGRIDVVIKSGDFVFVIEFKIGDAEKAMAQIKSKGYHQKYLGQGKKIKLVGIGFDPVAKNIGEYLIEEVAD
jgi:hypothetical protein